MAVVALGAAAWVAGPAPAQDAQIAALDLTRGKPVRCAELSTKSYPLIQGGCVLYASGKIDITVRTMFGPVRFGRCNIAINLLVGPTGSTWLQGFTSDSAGACGDMLPCREKASAKNIALADKLPWKGKIVQGPAGPQSELDLCLDTCMGRFEGRTTFDLVEQRGDRVMRATDSVAGVSGLELDGEWDFDVAIVGEHSQAYARRHGVDAPGFDLQ
ncbi:MAG TPA: hypothetical protein VEX36_07935 [Thermoleophilaceae bacterium]|nr:hypothetical protein [Thermoleophilaceae bacterium]